MTFKFGEIEIKQVKKKWKTKTKMWKTKTKMWKKEYERKKKMEKNVENKKRWA